MPDASCRGGVPFEDSRTYISTVKETSICHITRQQGPIQLSTVPECRIWALLSSVDRIPTNLRTRHASAIASARQTRSLGSEPPAQLVSDARAREQGHLAAVAKPSVLPLQSTHRMQPIPDAP